MNIGLSPIEWNGFAALCNRLPKWPGRAAIGHSRDFRLGLVGLAIALVGGFGIAFDWIGAFDGNAVANQPPLPMASSEPEFAASAAVASQQASPQAPEPASVDGLKIASQHWRRAGLGSNALVTFTLRNSNGYAVKDIEISCAFSRGDGTHLTDRNRIIHDTVRTRGRKRFTGLHVGFVNVNAERAKCAPVAASRA